MKYCSPPTLSLSAVMNLIGIFLSPQLSAVRRDEIKEWTFLPPFPMIDCFQALGSRNYDCCYEST